MATVPHSALRALAEETLDRLCEGFPMDYRPVLIWKGMRVSAGMAYFQKGSIGLSIPLLDSEERLISTLKHEYAHLLAYSRHGRKGTGHGIHWRNAMVELGEKPEVHHRYEVERNKPRQEVLYVCKKCGALIPRNRRLPKRRKYLHAACGGPIALQGVKPIARS
jgi:predicted SprT family Zn-dependent metalloprotease